MTYDICFDVASLFIMFVIIFGSGRSYIGSDLRHRRFKMLCGVLFSALCFDILAVVTASYPFLVPLRVNAAVQAVFFLLLSATIYTYISYVETFAKETRLNRIFRVINLAVYGLYAAIHILNIFGGFIFYFDEQLVYRKGSFYFIIIVVPVYLYLYGLVLLYINWKDLNRRQLNAAVILMPIMLVGVIVDVVILPYYEITLFAMTFGVLIIFLYLETPDYQKLQTTLEQLEQAKSEAERANIAKSAFLAQMSHEIRTPINAVLGMNEMILRESKEEDTLEYAGNAYNAGNALLSIINDILDISKIEAGRLEITEAEYDSYSLVSDCYLMVHDRAAKKGLELMVECDETLPLKLKGDMFHIRQIAVNLLTNAIKYTDKGSVRLKISGKESGSGFTLKISVKDTGIGLTEESKEKLFTSFQRFDLKRNQTVEGTGLGLAICKRLAELMGGSVEVNSVYGEGSEFICTVLQEVTDRTPIGKIDLAHSAKKVIAENKTAFTALDASILVVDDVEMNLVVFRNMLKEHGLSIDTADSGRMCLEMIQKKKYDIIFMDHMMPEMDGIETFGKMKETEHLNAGTPVVMLTANAIAGEKEKYLSAGFASYLTKPLQIDKLEKTLLRYIPDEKIIYGKDGKADEQTEALTDQNPGRLVALKEAAPDFDPAAALKNCGGDEDFYIELLKDFNIPKKLAELEESLSQKDWERYERIIHTVKGSMRTFGFPALGNIAEALQKAAEEHDENYIVQNHNKVVECLSRISECTEKT